MSLTDRDPCPCGAGDAFGACCAPVHRAGGAGLGTSAQTLMRARYSAYVVDDTAFVLASWHPDTRPADLAPGALDQEWLGLEVVDTRGGGALDANGEVEFRARFRRGDQHFELHERSTFTRVDGHWLYVDGSSPDDG